MTRRLLGGIAVAIMATGCSLGVSPSPSVLWAPTGAGYELFCGSMTPDDCLRWSGMALAAAQHQYPDKRVVSISITGPDGDYNVQFDDGTGIGADIN